MEAAAACSGDFDDCFLRVGLRRKCKGESLVLSGQRRDGDCLLLGCAVSPDERDVYLGTRCAAQIDAARVLLAVRYTKPGLTNAVRSFCIELNNWALIADEGSLLVHLNLIKANRSPSAHLSA